MMHGALGRPDRRLQLEAAHAWEESVDQILAEFETQQGRRPMYAICWY